jgi:hypothetical protein
MEYGGYGKMDPEYMKYLQSQGRRGFATDLGGLGLNVAGTALQGFGAYESYLQSERQREEEQRRYQEEQRIAADERRKRDQQQNVSNLMGYGGYAQTTADNRSQPYRGYAARVGL